MNAPDLAKYLSPLYSMLQGVPIFFILSGFLIWNSIARTDNFSVFVKKRVFRLYPELWGGVLLSFVVILVLYGSRIEWIPYLAFQVTQGSFLQFWTPDFLRGYGCGTPNGSLWTICVMLQAYIVMWLLYRFLHGKKAIFWGIFNVVCIALNFTPRLLSSFLPEMICKLYNQTFVPYLWLFVLGMTLCEFFGILIPFLKKFWYVFALIAAVLCLTGWDISGSYSVFKSLMMAPAIIGFAYRFPKLQIKQDFSYGLYIYHMIVINVMIHFGFVGNLLYVLVAFTISSLLAVLSYKTIGSIGRKRRKAL